jgi:hypothetical protein
LAAAQAGQAYQMVLAQVDAQQKQAIFTQQQELAMGQQLVAAAGMRGAAGVQLQAQLQQELALRQQGIDVTTRDSQARIANAGAVALQNLKMQDAAQAAQVGTQVQGQIMMYEAQTAAIGKTAAAKAQLLSLAQSEVQALAAEAQGMTETAAKIREYAGALADAAASNARAQEAQANRELAVSLQGTLDMVRMETAMVGQSNATRAYHITLLQYENQARQAEAQGLHDAAALYREYGRSIAVATSKLEARKQAEQEMEQLEAAAAAAAKARRSEEEAKAKAFQSTKFESTRRLTWGEYQVREAAQRGKADDVAKQMADAQKAGQQRQLQYASSTIQEQIQALQDQKTATQETPTRLRRKPRSAASNSTSKSQSWRRH